MASFPGRIFKEGEQRLQQGAFLCLAPSGIAPVEQVWALDPGTSFDEIPQDALIDACHILLAGGAIFLTSADAETVAEIRTTILTGLDMVTGKPAEMANA